MPFDCVTGCLALALGLLLFIVAFVLMGLGMNWLLELLGTWRCVSYPAC